MSIYTKRGAVLQARVQPLFMISFDLMAGQDRIGQDGAARGRDGTGRDGTGRLTYSLLYSSGVAWCSVHHVVAKH